MPISGILVPKKKVGLGGGAWWNVEGGRQGGLLGQVEVLPMTPACCFWERVCARVAVQSGVCK